jgi:hypothetical protein
LSDDDGTGAENEDRMDVGSFWHKENEIGD